MRKNPMNVFQPTGYRPSFLFIHPIRGLRIKFKQIKWAFQRIAHGFADIDVWNVDIWLANVLPDMLDQLANDSDGYPASEEFPTYFSWVVWLRERAKQIRSYNESDNQEEFTKAMEDVVKHINDLWW